MRRYFVSYQGYLDSILTVTGHIDIGVNYPIKNGDDIQKISEFIREEVHPACDKIAILYWRRFEEE